MTNVSKVNPDLVGCLTRFLHKSSIKKVSLANCLLSQEGLDALVDAAEKENLPIDTLVLCKVEIIPPPEIFNRGDRVFVDPVSGGQCEDMQQIAKLIGLIPLVTISGRFVRKSTLKMMRKIIRNYDKDKTSAETKISNLKGGIKLSENMFATDDVYLLQYHSIHDCEVAEVPPNFLELEEDSEGAD